MNLIQISPFLPNLSLKALSCSGSASHPGSFAAFTYHVPLVSFNLDEFLSLSLFHDLDILKRTGLLFCKMMSICICLVFPYWIQMTHLWQEYVGRDLRITHMREKVDTKRGDGVPKGKM